MNNLPKIYIIHYAKLVDRRKYLENELQKYGITNFEFITSYQRETTDVRTLNSLINCTHMTNVQKLVTFAHFDTYKKIINNSDNEAIILEDDTILCDNFLEKFNAYYEQLPKDYEIAILCDAFNMHPAGINSNQIWYRGNACKNTSAYLIKKEFLAKKLLPVLVPFIDVIDTLITKLIRRFGFIVYWCEPTLTRHGSDCKFYSQSYRYGGNGVIET